MNDHYTDDDWDLGIGATLLQTVACAGLGGLLRGASEYIEE